MEYNYYYCIIKTHIKGWAVNTNIGKVKEKPPPLPKTANACKCIQITESSGQITYFLVKCTVLRVTDYLIVPNNNSIFQTTKTNKNKETVYFSHLS